MLFYSEITYEEAERSPVSVFDFSNLINLELNESLKLQTPTIKRENPAVRVVLPPIDSITASVTADEADSLSSVSSLPEHDDDASLSSQSKKRSIFSKYWKKTGQQPVEFKKRFHPDFQTSSHSLDDGHQTCNSDLQDVKDTSVRKRAHQQANDSVPMSPGGTRRSIFGGRYDETIISSVRSLPILDSLEPSPKVLTRKTRSASMFIERPKSILKKKGHRQSRGDSSVSFDDNIDVVIFQSPKERWACEGWSNHFAC